MASHKPRKPYRWINSDDPAYGPICRCGKDKTLTALMCRECRYETRRGRLPSSLQPKMYSTELVQQWPMPVAFPPVVAGPPRKHWESMD